MMQPFENNEWVWTLFLGLEGPSLSSDSGVDFHVIGATGGFGLRGSLVALIMVSWHVMLATRPSSR